jgi:flagellar basal-body rod protein FlgB
MDNLPVNLFGGTISTLSHALDLRARNHELILNNVANADTPNYKPFAMNVEEALQESGQASSSAPLKQTDAKHLPGGRLPDDPSSIVTREADDPLLFRGDQNGVDIDAEMTALAKNSLLYKASAQLVTSKFSGLKKAISGGGNQ